jgi:hypothetical protein
MIAECKRLRDICVGPYKETLTSLTADGEIILNAPSANRLPVDAKSGGQPLAKPGRGSQPLAKNKQTASSSVRRSPRKAARMPLTEMRAVRKMETVLPRTVPATAAATFRPSLSGSSRTRRLLTGGDSRDSTPDSAAG